MKVNKTLLTVGLFGFLPLLAFSQSNGSTNSVLSASATKTNSVTRTQVEPSYPVMQYKLVEPKLAKNQDKDKILRLGRESSRAWTTIVSQQPNPTVVHNLSTHEPKFCLISFGQKPEP